MARIEGGDRSAFAAIYDRHSRRVFGISFSSLRNSQLAEEVTQDVFLRVWERCSLYDSTKSKFTTWLVSVTRNRVVDEARKQNRINSRNESEELLNFIQTDETVTESISVSNIEWESVTRVLVSLPNEQRQVIELGYLQGLTHREISEKLEIPSGTVKTRMRLALQKLRLAIAPETEINGSKLREPAKSKIGMKEIDPTQVGE